MTTISAINVASQKYALAWREFASASRATADQKGDLGTLISKGVPEGSDRFDHVVRTVGELQGTRDALAAAQTDLVKVLDEVDADTPGLSGPGAKPFRESIDELRTDVALPAAPVKWKGRLWSHGSSQNRMDLGFGTALLGGLGFAFSGGPLDTETSMAASQWVPIGLAGGTAAASVPLLAWSRRSGSAFAYVDAMTKLTGDAVAGKPAGSKIRLKTIGVNSHKRVKTERLLKGLDTLSANAAGRAKTAEAEALTIQRHLEAAQGNNSNPARLGSLLQEARSGARSRIEQAVEGDRQLAGAGQGEGR